MFEDQTFEVIMQRMLSRIPDDFDKRQGSVIWDMLAPAALELERAYQQLYLVTNWLYLSEDVPRDILLARVRDFGIEPKPAQKASGLLTFVGRTGTVIPANTRISTGDSIPIFFYTVNDAAIGDNGTATVLAEAELPGSSGNVPANAITVLVDVIDGVESVTNLQAFENGVDEESDESLLARYYERIRKPITSGNIAHYRQWALEVAGVGDAKVTPLWNGPGTVKITIVNTDMQPATTELVAQVQEYIEQVRPIGAAVTVASATGKPISVSANVILASGYTLQNVQDAFAASLDEYLKEIAFSMTYVSYAKIGTLLLSTPGVIDYSELTVNGSTANVALQDDEVPILGTVALGV
ncbi:baseplate J/gp47 family protein [Geobacillus kaustophilus NBRC 102445]|uniref:baseplate J/gp47 family protein n=1 Tax=Geobacillus thermoleovorans group TaxID=1505648 RepID=UPI0005A9F696|nr:baseplate J/gp47 family protein [Geobacillus kaustophilus]MED4973643.1 baseplate J/gp47 family protein [Geobacillus thermoleovorans]QCK81903.1 baseplate J/gp47 family protein [Geobacillus kaustophilus NBRC 102445]